jgi:hypothetical protein
MNGPGHPKPAPVCPEPKVFIGQIPLESTQEQVFALFQKYGTIKKCAVISGPDGRSKGCAMVTYEHWGEAELAVEHENGTANLGGARTLLVKFADPPRGRGDGPVMGIAPKKLFVGQVRCSSTRLPPARSATRLLRALSAFRCVRHASMVHSHATTVCMQMQCDTRVCGTPVAMRITGVAVGSLIL